MKTRLTILIFAIALGITTLLIVFKPDPKEVAPVRPTTNIEAITVQPMDIQLSVNGGTFASIFNDPAVNDAGEDVLDIDLTAYTAVTSATFRLFGTGATSGTGTFDLEPLTGVTPPAAIQVSGTAVAVPEPRASVLAIVGVLGLLLARRR